MNKKKSKIILLLLSLLSLYVLNSWDKYHSIYRSDFWPQWYTIKWSQRYFTTREAYCEGDVCWLRTIDKLIDKTRFWKFDLVNKDVYLWKNDDKIYFKWIEQLLEFEYANLQKLNPTVAEFSLYYFDSKSVYCEVDWQLKYLTQYNDNMKLSREIIENQYVNILWDQKFIWCMEII
jgi:hypothetical protein